MNNEGPDGGRTNWDDLIDPDDPNKPSSLAEYAEGMPRWIDPYDIMTREEIASMSQDEVIKRCQEYSLEEWNKEQEAKMDKRLLCLELEDSERESLLSKMALETEPPLPRDVAYTKLGTPCSPKWDDEWIALVEYTEEKVGRRCCGAHANELEACELEASHENGRCRFHGGFIGTGAQKGNANARIHGLYARRIQQCGSHCPHWETCPFAGDDVEKVRSSIRPKCVYEERELTALRQLDTEGHEEHVPIQERSLKDLIEKPYPMRAQLVGLRENLHMLQIMMTRAAAALSVETLKTETIQKSEKYYATHEKPSALLQAHRMITREYRLMMNTYSSFVKQWGLPKYEAAT